MLRRGVATEDDGVAGSGGGGQVGRAVVSKFVGEGGERDGFLGVGVDAEGRAGGERGGGE